MSLPHCVSETIPSRVGFACLCRKQKHCAQVVFAFHVSTGQYVRERERERERETERKQKGKERNNMKKEGKRERERERWREIER